MSVEKLIKDHAPILWIHPNEAFIPEDCGIMVKVADLYKDEEKVDSFKNTLSSLGKYGKGNYLKIPDIDMRKFTVPKNSGVAGMGPEAISLCFLK